MPATGPAPSPPGMLFVGERDCMASSYDDAHDVAISPRALRVSSKQQRNPVAKSLLQDYRAIIERTLYLSNRINVSPHRRSTFLNLPSSVERFHGDVYSFAVALGKGNASMGYLFWICVHLTRLDICRHDHIKIPSRCKVALFQGLHVIG